MSPHLGDAPMPVKVSVIVPVYNPGRYLERCIDSVLGQSLPSDEYEVIFVDDGSTDESPARLDGLVTAHPNITVIHQQNSGWPGKPRNVGLAAARGEYVFFLDHDDALGPEALESLYDFASRNGSDVVIGRVAGHGRGTARQLFAQTRDSVTLWDAPIINTLTPHKLFRRAFLSGRGLRFPEGRRRLEDYVFVLEAYFAASTISVLADPVCYHVYEREDRRNSSTDLVDPAYYYGFLREALAIVEAHTEPGPGRDVLLLRFVRQNILDRLAGPKFLGHPDAYRASLFAEIVSVVEDHIPLTVDRLLAPFQRTQMALVRARRLDLLFEVANWAHGLEVVARLETHELAPLGAIRLNVRVGLAVGGRALALESRDGMLLLRLPRDVAAAVPDDARAVGVPVRGVTSVILRRRSDAMDLVVPTHAERLIEEREGLRMIVDAVEATIDPGTFASGPRVGPRKWDVVARVAMMGVTREVRIAELLVTADHGVMLRRGSLPLGGKIRRLAVSGALIVSRHTDHRLRRRLWHVAGRLLRHLDA